MFYIKSSKDRQSISGVEKLIKIKLYIFELHNLKQKLYTYEHKHQHAR